MTGDRPLFGILLMVGFCALAPLSDALAKLVATDIPLGQIILIRFAFQALLLWPLVRRRHLSFNHLRPVAGVLLLRTFLLISGMWLMILSLRYLPLADAIAIAYVMPFILLLFGKLFLNEAVGARRLAACVVGFCGTLLVMQPSFDDVGWVVALPLAVAVVFSLFILVTRRLSRDVDPIAMQAVSGILGLLMLFPLIVFADGTGWAELDPVSPNGHEIILLAALGVLGTLSHLLLTFSLSHAPASTLAPVQYLEIPFAALFGWLIFSQFPNGAALWGVLVVTGAGLYVIWRERVAIKEQWPAQPTQAPPGAG